ncbi:MAG: leucine-rich repeat protein [Prevotella sp.]|nr:leucine-rich repeat protein [Prevotella sp.]
MKKSLLLFALTLLSTLTASAYDAEIDGIYYNLDSGAKEATVTSGDAQYTGNVSIPSTVTYNNVTYSVTEIGSKAFRKCSGLTSVSIPNSVTKIGDSAFGKCTGLTSFTLPNSVTSVGDWIFEDVDNFPVTVYNSSCFVILKNSHSGAYTIPAGIKTIAGGAFTNCTGLTSVTIPNSVTTIGEEAFAKTGLTSVTIPNSVTTIGDEAFEKCTYLETVVFPNNVANIGESIFSGCTALKSPIYTSSVFICMPTSYKGAYTVPAGIKRIVSRAFYKCEGLTSVTIPSGVAAIENYTFNGCTALSSVSMSAGVTSIGDYAFYNCSALTSANIPDGVTSIGSSAFSGCSSLTAVTIPNSVATIGYSAFFNCIGLKSMTVLCKMEGIESSVFQNCTGELTVGYDIPSASSSRSIFYLSKFSSVIISNGVTSIGNYAFYLCDSIKTITIPGSVTSIGTKAFYRSYSSPKLQEIYNYASTPQILDIYTIDTDKSTILHVKHGYKEVYEDAYIWKNFTIIDDLYDNVIYAKETSVQNATFTVPVVAKHLMNVSGFSFNFKCPEGFTVKKIARGAAVKTRDDGDEYYFNQFQSSLKEEGMYYVLCTTSKDYYLPESNEDELAIITLEANMDATNGDYPLVIIDGELAYGSENTRVDYYETPLHFEFLPGDANGDGRISIADVTAIAAYLLNEQPPVFYKSAAAIANGYKDVDSEGNPRLSVGDITAIVDVLLKKDKNN